MTGASIGAASAGGSAAIGDGNVWEGTSVADALATAGSGLQSGDILRVGDDSEPFGVHVDDDSAVGLSVMPRAVGGVGLAPDGEAVLGFREVDPVAAGIDDWAHIGELGVPTYVVSDGVLTLGAAVGSTQGSIARDDGERPASPILVVIEDLSCTAPAVLTSDRPYIQIYTEDGDRFFGLRPQGTTGAALWGITQSGADIALAGATVGVASTLEIYIDTRVSPSLCAYRFGRAGDWTVITPTLLTFSTTRSFLSLVKFSSAAQSISMRSVHIRAL